MNVVRDPYESTRKCPKNLCVVYLIVSPIAVCISMSLCSLIYYVSHLDAKNYTTSLECEGIVNGKNFSTPCYYPKNDPNDIIFGIPPTSLDEYHQASFRMALAALISIPFVCLSCMTIKMYGNGILD
jgi:hypothetical protein